MSKEDMIVGKKLNASCQLGAHATRKYLLCLAKDESPAGESDDCQPIHLGVKKDRVDLFPREAVIYDQAVDEAVNHDLIGVHRIVSQPGHQVGLFFFIQESCSFRGFGDEEEGRDTTGDSEDTCNEVRVILVHHLKATGSWKPYLQ